MISEKPWPEAEGSEVLSLMTYMHAAPPACSAADSVQLAGKIGELHLYSCTGQKPREMVPSQ